MTFEQIFVFVLIGVVFISFFKEFYPPEVIALSASAALLATGIIQTRDFLSVFSSSAPITIAMMFIISAALERTGVLAYLGDLLQKQAKGSFLRAILIMMIGTMLASAFMNNTPVVILMTPVMISIAAGLGLSPSRFLIPLSFSAIFGGTLTLVGTSTNILMSDVATDSGLAPVSMFEMTLPGLILAAVGMVYMVIASRFLLPDRTSLANLLAQEGKRAFVSRLVVPPRSRYIGKPSSSLPFDPGSVTILDVVRNGLSMRRQLDRITLQAGDRIVIQSDTGEILGLKDNRQVAFRELEDTSLEPVTDDSTLLLEAGVGPRSTLIGRPLGDLGIRRKYGVYVLAVHRKDENITSRTDSIQLQLGDTVLLEGPAEGIERLLKDGKIINLSQPSEPAMRRRRAPISVAVILSVIGLAALNVMPIAGLSVIGAVVVMLTKCIDPKDAVEAIDWRILLLIFGLLGLSQGMETTGAAEIVVETAVRLVEGVGPLAVLAAVYVLTSVLTEMVSNNAVAVLVGPIVIDLALELGFDARPFIIAVMFAASASFATPIGYQTNTFVYGAGGYKFRDFLVIGLPLNFIFAAMATLVIPLFFPF
ncbi:SLC13 family permease [Roseibium sp. SCP14]|uniref:SLC13 family permease n=1 Tax=Roseibium sp. SCP14 TaxID=3141375 RepID=UPI003334A7CD